MAWDPNSQYWSRPSLMGENMNRWTPLDSYRPLRIVWLFAALLLATWLFWPGRFESTLMFSLGALVGANWIDRDFWEYRASIHYHLQDKYGPDWQKIDDDEP